jgi:hypothetical protein
MRIILAAAALAIAAPRLHAQYAGAMGQTIDGISCDASEGQRIHIHQHLVIMDHGHPVEIPSTIGQVPARRCLYWVHTHTPDGIIHIEAPKDQAFTLGNFFKVWGQPITRSQVGSARLAPKESMRVYVNGKRFTGDPAAIKLEPHADIFIEVGAPFAKVIPKFTNWGTL